MMGTIAPAVRGRFTSYLALTVFALASVSTAVIIGVLLSWDGALLPSALMGFVVAAVSVVYLGLYITIGRMPTLLRSRQMPVGWLRPERPVLSAMHFGLVMGSTYTIPITGGSVLVLGGVAAG